MALFAIEERDEDRGHELNDHRRPHRPSGPSDMRAMIREMGRLAYQGEQRVVNELNEPNQTYHIERRCRVYPFKQSGGHADPLETLNQLD